jgi:ABC-type Mn2+/Zn2+ transport system permease subunit
MATVGQACLILALLTCAYGIGASLYGASARRRDWVDSGRRAVYALAVLATAALGRAWTAIGFDPDSAGSLGLPAGRADLLLLAFIAVAAVAAIPAVGALLVSAFLVVPAATARQLSRSVPSMLLVGVGSAAVEGIVGLYLAYWLDAPPGPAIATLGAAGFGVASLVARAS